MDPVRQNEHDAFMSLALEIAFQRAGLTSPNPPVGAVIARQGQLITTGGTGPYGSNHAELNAIIAAGDAARGADIYVSLEPCSHFGKTPPCTRAIIEAGVTRVFCPLVDPNPLVSGRGFAALREAGVEVHLMNTRTGHAVDFIRPFKKHILRGRPFVIAKSAVTLDGRIATKTGDSRWVSGPVSRRVVHRLRTRVDACIVGKNTLVRDDPSLDVRMGEFTVSPGEPVILGRDSFFLRRLLSDEPINEYRDPLRVVVGLPDDLTRSYRAFRGDNYRVFERRSLFVARAARDRVWAASAESLNLVLLDAESPVDEIPLVMAELGRLGILAAMLEGGGGITGSFFDAGEIDQFFTFVAPRVAGNGISPVFARGAAQMDESLDLQDVSMAAVGADMLITGYREGYHLEMM